MRGFRIVSVVLCLWAAFAVPAARADAATDAFHAAVADAYRHYREAVHYLENDNPELAALALEEFHTVWDGVIRKYADSPPPAYTRDPSFKATLAAIRAAAADAAKPGAERRPQETARVLAPIVTLLAEQRRRSSQRVYSDCIDPMNAAMNRLWAYRRAPPAPDNPESVAQYKAAVQETTRWYRQCRDEAPAEVRDTEEFRRLFDGALASLAKLEAVDIAHTDALSSLLRELHSFDRLIWLRFG